MNQINSRILELLTHFINNIGEFEPGTGSNKYELSLGQHMASGLNVPFISSKDFIYMEKPGFCRSNIIMPDDFHAVVHEPFGSQSGPDIAIFMCGRMLPIEMKTAEGKKPVFNSVPPKPGRLYIFVHIPKKSKKRNNSVRAFGFDGCIFGISSSVHELVHQRLKQEAEKINSEFGMHNGKIHLYNRAMYTCDMAIDRHYLEFDNTVLNFGWDFLDFGALIDHNDQQDDN